MTGKTSLLIHKKIQSTYGHGIINTGSHASEGE